jgi:NADPH-dependent 2,4-dienoyl-CoA reductase/sulfur reductase-like enzyme
MPQLEPLTAATIAAADAARSAVVGASFMDMEAAASLRSRGMDVTVVAPDEVPFRRLLGPELGARLWRVHEDNGVAFRLSHIIQEIDNERVVLDDKTEIEADLVLVGIGVGPNTTLAESAGLLVNDGVLVDYHLRTAIRGSTPPATALALRIHSPVSRNESSTGSLHNDTARPHRPARVRHGTGGTCNGGQDCWTMQS